MMDPFYTKIVDRIAKELGQPSNVVERVVRHQFKFVADNIQKGGYQNVRLHYFGVFGVRPGRLYKLGKEDPRRAKKEERIGKKRKE